MMDGVVNFSYQEFIGIFPEIKTSPAQAKYSFDMACGMINNTPHSVVCECDRKQLLYLLTAHILTLNKRGAGNIGTVSNASEGSVSVGFNTGSIDKMNAGWFGQTQYGLMFYQISKKYRSGFLVV